MARTRTIQSVNAEISKVQTELSKLKEKCDVLTNQLSELQKEKHELEGKQIVSAYVQSGKSLEEVLTFLEE